MSSGAQGSDEKYKQGLTRVQVWLYCAGYLVLFSGSAGSAWVYRVATDDAASQAIIARAQDTKKNQYQLEVIGGKANVVATEIQQWFSSLWHGRQLADTLAVLTFAAALACFFIAYFLPDLPPFDDGAPGKKEPPGK
jgi:hypothetical protein